MPPEPWLPPSTFYVDGWRVTLIWRQTPAGPACVGVTVLADPDSDRRLVAATVNTLSIADLIARGPVPDRLRRAVDAYLWAGENQVPRAKAVAAEVGIAETSASNLISKIRNEMRLLPPTRPGVSAA